MDKVTVYFAKHEDFKEQVNQPSAFAPSYLKKFKEAKNEHRKMELLCSGILLRDILGFKEDSDFVVSPSGALSTAAGLRNFCLSHARDYTILAVADSPITLGADLEELHDDMSQKQIHHRLIVAKKVFPPVLMEQYTTASPKEEPMAFTRLWTQVEAALKAEGSGFYTDPLKHPDLFHKWTFQTTVYQDHVATVATLAAQGQISLEQKIFRPSH